MGRVEIRIAIRGRPAYSSRVTYGAVLTRPPSIVIVALMPFAPVAGLLQANGQHVFVGHTIHTRSKLTQNDVSRSYRSLFST